MSLPLAFNRAPLALLPAALLALACTRTNPDYCDDQIHCSGGRFCDQLTNSCLLVDAAAEPDAPARADTREAAVPDARNSCATHDDCKGSDQGPTCVRGLCKKCLGANDCKPGLVCALDTGRCVECTDTEGCLATPASPICVENKCAPCRDKADSCMARYPATPVCDPAGPCVECVVDSDCKSPTKPICDTAARKCVACTADSQCAGRHDNAGVCLFHLDGHCAAEAEVIHVKNGTGCSMTPGVGGTAAAPFCFSQQGIDAVTATKRVVLLHGPDPLTNWTAAPTGPLVSVIGQDGATIAPGAFAGIRVSGGEVYLRGLTVANGTQNGVVAENGATLRMNRCTITNNRGGLLVLGAGFDIANTVIAKNRGAVAPNTTTSYGGVYLRSAAGQPALFRNNTVADNEVIGLVCEGSYPVKSVLATGNAVQDMLNCVATGSSKKDDLPHFDAARPYHLTAASPCVDTGDQMDFPTDDLDGDPRPLGAGNDCGADEFKP